jgi:hypothetical protein
MSDTPPQQAPPPAQPAPAPAPAPEPQRERTVPYQRFTEVYDELKELRTWKETHAPTLQEVDTLRSQVSSMETRHAEDRALWRHGLVDEDAADVARLLYGKVDEADRPEGGIDAWLGGFGEGEGKTAPPRALAPFLGAPAAPPAETPPPVRPPPSRPVPTPSGKVWDEASINELARQCEASGNWDPWDAAQEDILASQNRS